MEGAEVGKGQETKEGARWKGAMSRARKDRFIVQRAAASGTGGAGAGRVVGGGWWEVGGTGGGQARDWDLGSGTWDWDWECSLSLLSLGTPLQRMSAREHV